MKALFRLGCMIALLLSASSMYAQIVLPDDNPYAILSQNIGFNKVTIEYTRPSVRGRVIFGDLVPYNQEWLTNNQHYVRMRFVDDILFDNGEKLSAGTYYMTVIPGKETWRIIFSNNEWRRFPILIFDEDYFFPVYRPKDAVTLEFTVKPQKMKEQVETFTMELANVCTTCAEVQLMWDYTRVSFGISTEADAQVLSDIKSFTSNPEAKLGGQYFLAAKYYLETNRDLPQALIWVNKSLEYIPDAYWVLHMKAEIQARMGDYKEAIKTAELSMEKARTKGSDEYVRMNEREIEHWKNLKKGGTD